MPAGIGAGGYCALTFETVMGTYLPPTTGGTLFLPIISENLQYQEDKYFASQLRQQAIVSAAEPSFYHVAGDIVMEVDTAFLPALLHCSRHTITKTGTVSPFTYKYVPSTAGSATTAASGAVARSCSISVIRNGVGFGYGGCVMQGYEFTIVDGVLRVTAHVLGLSEATPGGLGTPAWATPKLMGADASSVFVAAAAVGPTFGAASTDFNGWTLNINHNGSPQNRIRSDRAASYISYGETEVTLDTELDFIDKTEYDLFKATTMKAYRLESIGDGAAYAASTDALRQDLNNAAYTSYEIGLGGIGELIMAGVSARGVHIAGGSAYSLEVKSTLNIA